MVFVFLYFQGTLYLLSWRDHKFFLTNRAINTFLCVTRSVTPFLLRSQGRSEGHGLHFSSRISPSPNRSIHRHRERAFNLFLWRQKHRAHTEYTFHLVYVPSWWKNQPWRVRVRGARPPPSLYLPSRCGVRSSWEGWYTSCISSLPLFVLWGQKSEFWRNKFKISGSVLAF